MKSKSPTVILVDDDHNILASYVRGFHKFDVELITADSAEKAIEILKTTTADAIISDENMKGMNGTEFLKWVRENRPGTSRIIITGQPNVPSMQKAMNEAGVQNYLMKPVTSEQLVEAVFNSLPKATT